MEYIKMTSQGAPVARFTVLKQLGKGAGGFVQMVRDKHRDNQEVAVKYIKRVRSGGAPCMH